MLGNVNVGMARVCRAQCILVLSRSADDGEAIKRMPWRVIVMVCGVTVLIALVERAQGIDLLVSLVARIASAEHRQRHRRASSPESCPSTAARPVSCCRRFSRWFRASPLRFRARAPLSIATSMNIGGHLVDVSPLSTIGALCLAGAADAESRDLFNKLLAWGLSMAVVGAILCHLIL